MKKISKIVCALLAMLTFSACFVGCANTGGGDATKKDETVPPSVGSTVLAQDVHDVPQMDYNDELIVIYSRGHEWFDDDVCVDADLGDKITKAVWERQAIVERHLGVELKNVYSYDDNGWGYIGDDVQNMRDAGRNDYSIVADALYHAGVNTCNNLYLDISNLQYLDLTKDYWAQGVNSAASYKGKQFYVMGAIAIATYRMSIITLFNETTFKNLGYEDPYAWVDTGEWTISKMYTLAEQFYDDSTGDVAGEKDENDTYGVLCSTGITLDAFIASCDLNILAKNAEDKLVNVFDSQKAARAAEAVGKLYWECKGSYPLTVTYQDKELNTIAEKFAQEKSAMAMVRLIEVETSYVSGATFGLGVLPVPKYEEGAGTYHTTVHDQATAFAIPNLDGKTNGEMQMLGAVLEVMASEGANTILPAYYEIVVKERTFAETKSMQMIDRIVKNVVFEPATYYANVFGGTSTETHDFPHGFMRDVVGRSSTKYKKAQKYLGVLYVKIDAKMEDINNMLDGIDGKLAS